MAIMFLIGLALLLFTLISLILPWVQQARLTRLEREIRALKAQLTQGDSISTHTAPAIKPEVIVPVAAAKKTQPFVRDPIIQPPLLELEKAPTPAQPVAEPVKREAKPRLSFEQQFGARLPVWIGGIALALAGFYMVKYSIETGLLSPAVRVVLGLIFGCGLLYVANLIRNKPDFANGARISQALSGAGIADLYVCLFAASSLYHLISPLLGFIAMGGVTAVAVLLSLRHGMPIALLGLVGGFLTPTLVGSSEPNAALLFIYLYFVFAGLMLVIRKQAWWGLAIPAVLGGFLWVGLWVLDGNFAPGDSIWLGLFLIAVSATVVAASRESYDDEAAVPKVLTLGSALNYLSLGGGLLLMGVVAARADFGLMEWGLFGLLSLGGIGLAYYNQRLYGLVPWLSMGVNAAMLVVWSTQDANMFALIVSLFGVLYIASGYVLQSRSARPLIWSGLTAAASIGYYLIAYYELRTALIVTQFPLFWGILALGLAAFATCAVQRLMQQIPDTHAQKQHVLAIYAATATTFISLALTIELPREFLSVAFAGQVLAMAWLSLKLEIRALRGIAGILALIFGFLLLPQILLLLQLTAYSLVEARLHLQDGIPMVDWPVFQLGLPALCFVGASYLLRTRADDRLVRGLEIAAIALIGVMGYYLTRQAFHVDESVLFVKAGFVERGVITNILFAYGLACVWVGRQYARHAVRASGFVLAAIAAFRIGYFDFIAYNPYWSKQAVGSWPVLNALLLVYGLPILWLWRVTHELALAGKTRWLKYGYGLMLALAFALITFNVRQIFHGTYLNSGLASNAETYSYSVAWLLFGLGLLVSGTVRKDKLMRVASLLIMILTVGKVFLHDASELEGLFRVFSFFGLGLCLIGLSWFYTRFVFGPQTEQDAEA